MSGSGKHEKETTPSFSSQTEARGLEIDHINEQEEKLTSANLHFPIFD